MPDDTDSIDIGPVSRDELDALIEALEQRLAYLRAVKRRNTIMEGLLTRYRELAAE